MQSRGPLFVRSELCPGREAGVPSQALQGNGYPKGFIHKHTCPQPDQWTPHDQVARGSVTVPYISGLSESIRRVLAPLAIQVSFSHYGTLRQDLVHPKNPAPANHRKGVVYSIPCAECPRTYIGQTGRSLDHRLREHRQALKNGDLGSSALAEHVFSANHRVNPSKAMVIDTHNHTRPGACWSPGTSSTTSPPSTGRRAPCQDSMLHYWPDRASIWHNPIFVLLLLLIF